MAGANETYTIDIQAALPEGASVTAKLDSLTKSLLGAEKSASFFDAAAKQVAASLAAAKAATADANTALDAGNAQWAELEANANRAAKAFEKAAGKGVVGAEIAGQAEASKRALDEYAVTLAALEHTAADARTSEQALGIALGQTRDAAKQAASAEAALAAASAAAAREVEAAAKAQARAMQDAADEVARAAEAEAAAVAAAAEATAAAAKDAADAATKAAKEQAAAAKDAADAAEKAARAPLEAAHEQAQAYGLLRGSLAALPGPLGKLASAALAPAQGFQKLSAGMGASRAASVLLAAGAAALALAIVAVTVAAIAGTIKIAAWAVGLADAARTSELATEAFEIMNPALAGLDFAGVANETGLAAGQIQGLAKQLQKAGVAAEDMPAALRAAAIAQRALGSEGAGEFIESLKDAKGSVGALARETSAKLGGVVARQLMGLDAQSERFSRNIDGLFGGLNIDPVLEGMRVLVDLFDKNTAAGAALQFLFETVFQPLIDTAKTAALAIEAFYLGVMIGAMQLYIDLKPTIKAIKEFFGLDSAELAVSFETITEIGRQLAPVFAVIATIVGAVLVAAFAAIGAAIAVNIAAWYLLIEAIKLVVAAFTWIVDAVVDAYDYVAAIDWGVLGRSLIDGFVGGIKAGAGAVVSAITGVVGGAISAAKRMLGIASPSKVFLGIGADTGEGFAGGVEDSTNAAHEAIATLASPQAALQGLDAAGAPAGPAPLASAPAGGAGAAAGARTVTLYNPVIQLGPGTPKQQAQEFVTWITELLEGDAAQAAGA